MSHTKPNRKMKIKTVYNSISESSQQLPLYLEKISAGFPSPGEDYVDKELDLNDHLIKHPAATFFVRVEGDSMINAGIHDADLLIVDRSLEPGDRKIVIAVINGEMTVKRIRKQNNKLYLIPENNNFKYLEITPDSEFQVWGVVTYVIHKAV